MGGIEHYDREALRKSKMVYDVIEESVALKANGKASFSYKCVVPPELRSTMNQVFTIDHQDPTLNDKI